MLGRDVVTGDLILLKFLAMPDIPRHQYDDEQGDDDATNECAGIS
ncbi:hypothetical protein [Sphingobium yanoikuyae]|jgi:hypothetical protein|nr:hypothetical protein [Sphingobium yanoikuyae]HEV7435121.1 hypothetical protein [Pseudorhizobium sp.]